MWKLHYKNGFSKNYFYLNCIGSLILKKSVYNNFLYNWNYYVMSYLKIPLQNRPVRVPVQKFLTAWWKVKIITRVPDASFIEADSCYMCMI